MFAKRLPLGEACPHKSWEDFAPTQNGLLSDSDSIAQSVAAEVVELAELTENEQRDRLHLELQKAAMLRAEGRRNPPLKVWD
jgi:hypothetical protein